MRRRGKHLLVDFAGELVLLIHLMSAGRLQLYDKRAGPRDRTSRLLVRAATEDGERELRLREFGSKQAAWVKLLRARRARAGRGARRRSDRKPGRTRPRSVSCSTPRARCTRCCAISARSPGIGRSWVDEILWEAELSPYKRGGDLDAGEAERLRDAVVRRSARRSPTTSRRSRCRSPTSCRCRCASTAARASLARAARTTLQAVHFEDYVIAYCPACQTEGRVLKDRRLSRLLR